MTRWWTNRRTRQPFTAKPKHVTRDPTLKGEPEIFESDLFSKDPTVVPDIVNVLKRPEGMPAEKEFMKDISFNDKTFKQVVKFFLSRGFRAPSDQELQSQGFQLQSASQGVGDFEESANGIVVFVMQKPSGGKMITAYIGTDKNNLLYGITYTKPATATQGVEDWLVKKQEKHPNYSPEQFRQQFRNIAILYDDTLNEWESGRR